MNQAIPTNELVDISTLKPNPKNPRSIKQDDLARLKRQLGKLQAYKPIVIDTRTGLILDGHMRTEALKQLGVQQVWVSYIETKDDTEALEYMLSSNDQAGRYDDQLLAELVAESPDLSLGDYKIDLGEPVDLGQLLAQFGPEAEIEEDEAPEPPVEPQSRLGDVYQLGRHRLMCGSATDLSQMEVLMNGIHAAMAFTDPPYLMAFEGNVHGDGTKSFNAKHGGILNDKLSPEEERQFLDDTNTAIRTYVDGAYYICFYRLGLHKYFASMDRLDMEYRALIIWDKGVHTLSNSDYMSRYEPIIYGWNGKHNFYGGRSNFDIWNIERTKKNELHPTMKPIALCAHAITNSSKTDDIVLDLFGGSGSTLIACEQLNRTCYMMELDPHYVDVILTRWSNLTGEDPVRVEDGKKWSELNG